ncbi:MAG: DUF433 domain-containing protein [Rivularia sp. (in: cyanobacteria)]
MNNIFTPTEAAAIVQIPIKRVYKELEYAIVPSSNPPRLPFEALVYLRALKEVDFTFSVDFRTVLYKRLVDAIAHNNTSLEIARYFILQLDAISNELLELINRFNGWKEGLVTNQAIMGGETVFSSSRLTVRHIGTMLERGESKEVIREDYHYLSEEDMEFALIYTRAYPIIGRPKK